MKQKRGEIVLGLAGMSPKKPFASKDDEGGAPDDEDSPMPEEAEELPMVAVTAAEELCRDLGIDEEKADAVARSIRKICM